MASVIRLSYYKRLFLVLLAFLWSMVLCFVGFQYMREKRYKSELLNGRLQLYNSRLLEKLERGLPYDTIAGGRHPYEGLRISVVTLSGDVVYDNMLFCDSLDNHRLRPEVAGALKSGSGYHIGRRSASDGRVYFYSATQGDGFVVRTAVPYSASLHELLRADLAFIGLVVLIALAISISGFFVARRLGGNIERLDRFASKAERGEPFDDDRGFPDDELGSISNHIVSLYEQWQQTVKDRDAAHRDAMRREQEKIGIKRQLTDNMNHELKTPVAAMQVCLETLLSGIDLSHERRQELIERCYIHNGRLMRLLGDVSLITRMEDGGHLIGKEPVVVNDIVEEIARELAIMPEEERMMFHVRFDEPVVIYGNMSLIVSVFRNLTENAIAYSGGRNIYVSLLENDDDRCTICFEDDGCGVGQEHLPRLFERFYRVDKGRSRRMGGTGLGLAIVKHAVRFHGGVITVANRPGGGLRFEFSLMKR